MSRIFKPFHLVDGSYQWEYSTLEGYYNADVTLKINVEPPSDSYYYWSHSFSFINGNYGDIGLQSNGDMGAEGRVGKIANFSIVNAIASVAGPNAICGEFDGKGKGFSCRLKYNWQESRSYRMRIWYEGKGWWGAYFCDTMTEEEVFIGRIQTHNSWQLLRHDFVVFSEYLGRVRSSAEIPYAKITFSDFRADNGSVICHWRGNSFHKTCKNVLVVASDTFFCVESGEVVET